MKRKLTVILSADVVGYAGQMQRDEAGTLRRLKDNRAQIFDPQVAAHGGRVFKLMGDGALAEFPSAIAAVECALAIQAATEQAASADANASPVRYRIGINLGEVIVDGEDLYGEGVNTAARLQALGPVGGVSLSKVVRDTIVGKLAVVFEDLGQHQIKENEQPVHAFAVGASGAAPAPAIPAPVQTKKVSICVLPFANISGDVEQEYFSDGITEDIITDLSKVSALSVTARHTAFPFKGMNVDAPQVARQVKASHVLEGSVRKAGGRVRITAQLIDGASGEHIWAERWDRDYNDIFALQDEISQAVVDALKVRLLPEEKKAIGRRGTDNVEAYNLFLMARQYYVAGAEGDTKRDQTIIRLCRRATEIDPGYGDAWALMALGQYTLSEGVEGKGDGGLEAVERAIASNANLAEAHAVRGRLLFDAGRTSEANAEIELALRLDPESYEVNRAAGNVIYRQQRFGDAAPYFEKALALMENEFNAAIMLMSCYDAVGDAPGLKRTAGIALARGQKVLEADPRNGAALEGGVHALAALGEVERAKEWMSRALLIYPENTNMRYNFACTLSAQLRDVDGALELLSTILATATARRVQFARIDPDLERLRSDPRFEAMLAAAEARLAREAPPTSG